MEKTPKYKIGTIVRVIGNSNRHVFELGTIVMIVDISGFYGKDDCKGSRDYRCEDPNDPGTNWWVLEEEMILVENAQPELKYEIY